MNEQRERPNMNIWHKQYPNAPLHEPSGKWFVNRKWELDTLWEWALSIPTKGSYSITGLRRTGKSTLMAKLYNRLYFEQERVMPIYITFGRFLPKPAPITSEEFVDAFFAGVMRSYLTFQHKRPEFQQEQDVPLEYLYTVVQELNDETALQWFQRYYHRSELSRSPSSDRMHWVINFLKSHAYRTPQPMVILIDEFQVLTTVRNVDDDRIINATGYFQSAAESWDAPLLVSGSSISMLRGQALGGALSGRFSPFHIGSLEPEHAVKMVSHLGEAKKIPVTEEVAEAVVKTTQGYPYSIESVMLSKSPDIKRLPDVKAVDEIVNFELSSHAGALGRHYEEEYGKYVTELNGDDLTRKILYWITNQKTLQLHLHPRRVAEAINADVIQVQKSLEKLCQLDIIQRVAGAVYTGPADPLMRMYLKYSHYLNVDDLSPNDAARKLRQELNQRQGETNRQTGHFTEIIVAGAVRAFDDSVVDGQTYFGTAGNAKLYRCDTIHRREGTITGGRAYEIDIIGEYRLYDLPQDVNYESNAGNGAWMVSVRYRSKRMGVADVRQFIRDVGVVQAEKGYGEVIRWYFSKTGFTREAKALLQSEEIYHSDLEQFNQLAEMFDLMPLRM